MDIVPLIPSSGFDTVTVYEDRSEVPVNKAPDPNQCPDAPSPTVLIMAEVAKRGMSDVVPLGKVTPTTTFKGSIWLAGFREKPV
jgi:hypothetical protein